MEPANSTRARCAAVFNLGHMVLMVTGVVSLAGTTAGVYASLHGDIVENKRAFDDLQKRLDLLDADFHRTMDEEHRYDAEIRKSFSDLDRENRSSLRDLGNRINALAVAINQAAKQDGR